MWNAGSWVQHFGDSMRKKSSTLHCLFFVELNYFFFTFFPNVFLFPLLRKCANLPELVEWKGWERNSSCEIVVVTLDIRTEHPFESAKKWHGTKNVTLQPVTDTFLLLFTQSLLRFTQTLLSTLNERENYAPDWSWRSRHPLESRYNIILIRTSVS